MTRRKGEKPVERRIAPLTPSSPVMRMIADGDRWFYAFMFQYSTPLYRLAKETGISQDRLQMIAAGEAITHDEVDALARAWWVTSEDLIGALPPSTVLID